MKSFKAFLPHILAYQIEELGLFSEIQNSIEIVPLNTDWQTTFCETIGYPVADLPWTQLRLAQFGASSSVKSACCCDPVMMQMTHRGAYMVGQGGLTLTQNDAIRIVAKINEKLMRHGERLYLVDKHAWLFTSEKALELTSFSIQELIGKDMFNFSYQGGDASYWQQLANEIQMLIKQMMDYDGLMQTAPETIMNVHFYNHIDIAEPNDIPFVRNKNLTIVSDNELIKTFCERSFISYKPNHFLNEVKTSSCVAIAFDNEKEFYSDLIQFWLETKSLKSSCIICQDAEIKFKAKQEKHVISVFTDVDCAYCRKLHKEVSFLNDNGVTVRYLAFPRAGIGSDAYQKLVSVWCADNKTAAMDEAKLKRQFGNFGSKS